MNELQIRLTADIQGLQSAINKAKQTLKSFESETATDSEKSNVGFRRKIGLIEQLNAKAKQLKVSLTQATNEQQIAAFNAELEQTNIELARLNALGKTFSAPAVRSFENLKSSAGAATGSAIAFSRIIQDAPFGIIGVANNLQSFGEQFVALGGKATTAGQRLSMFFSALITPSNLAILAISALTAAWQAYSLGLFDSEEETRDLNKELEDYKNNLDGITKAQLDGVQSAQKEIQALELLRAQAENDGLSREKRLLAVKELKKEWPEYLKGFSDEEILLGKVGNAYIELTKKLTAYATAQALSAKVGENNAKAAILQIQEEERAIKILAKRAESAAATRMQTSRLKNADQFTVADPTVLRIQKELNDLIQETTDSAKEREKLGFQNLAINKKISEEIKKAGGLIEVNNDKVKENNRELNYYELIQDRINEKIDIQKKILTDLAIEQKRLFEQITRLRQEPIDFVNAASLIIAEKRLAEIDKIIGSIASKRENTEITIDESKLEGLEKSLFGKGKVQALEEEIASLQARIKVTVDPEALERYKQQLITAQDALSDLLGKRKLQVEDLTQAFVGLGSVIGRAFKNPQLGTFVSQFASFVGQIVAGAFAVAKANAVAGATQSSLFTGPAAAFTLPAFIASAVGVVASAFAALGNFGAGGASPQGGTGTTFTNRREFGGPVSKGRAYIVGERRPELFVPNTNGIIIPQLPSMDYSGARVNSSMYGVEVMLKGPDDLLFFVEQAQIRRGLR